MGKVSTHGDLMATSALVTSTSAVAFEEDVVFPAAHPQKGAPDNGEVVGKRRVDRDLSRGTAWKIVAGGIILDSNDGDGATGRNARAHVL